MNAAVKKAREALRLAIAGAVTANSEVNFTFGYRAGRLKNGARQDDDEAERLWQREREQWETVSRYESKLDAAISAYATAVRRHERTRFTTAMKKR